MKKKAEGEVRPEYEFTGMTGIRGKYAKRYKQGANIIRLDPDLAELFPDSGSVNRALRVLADLARQEAASHKAS